MMHGLTDTKITDLGFAGGFALWGIRAIVTGHENCCQLTNGFDLAFTIDNMALKSCRDLKTGEPALKALKGLCRQIEATGKRKIKIFANGCLQVTSDELSLVAAIAAAQAFEETLCDAHLSWLLGTQNTHMTYQATITYGLICAEAGLYINAPHALSALQPSYKGHDQFARLQPQPMISYR